MGNSRAVIRQNRIIMFAILHYKQVNEGGIKGKRVTRILYEWMLLNGAKVHVPNSVNTMMNEAGKAILRVGPAKSTDEIVLNFIPEDLYDEVITLLPELIWEAPPTANKDLEAGAVFPDLEIEAPDPIMPTPEEVADAILRKVMEMYNMEIPEEDPEKEIAWRRALEQTRKLTELQLGYDRQRDDLAAMRVKLDAANIQIRRLKAEKVTLEGNVQAALRQAGKDIQDEVSRGVGSALRITKTPNGKRD